MERRLSLQVLFVAVLILFGMGKISHAQTAKPIELKLSHFMSPMHTFHVYGFVPFSKEVEERTKGRVKITVYPSEALGKAKDHYDMAKQGVTDIAHIVQGYTPGRYPLTSVMELPIDTPSGEVGSRVLWGLYEKYLKAEYPGVKVLSLYTTDPGQIFTTKKPVKTVEDIKGLRVRSPGPQQTAMLKELGASPLSLPLPEVYDALQRGIADGVMTPTSAIKDAKFHEVTKYQTICNLFTIPCALVMDLKVWNSLPPDIQKIFEELTGSRMSEIIGKAVDQTAVLSLEAAKTAGVQTYKLSPEEMKQWASRVKPVNDKWIEEMESKDLQGKMVYEEATQLIKKYSK